MKHARKDYDRIQDPENKIAENEPVFLVRAQDPLAAETMRYWAWLHRRRLKDHGKADDGMADLVEGHADSADAWQPKKMFADM